MESRVAATKTAPPSPMPPSTAAPSPADLLVPRDIERLRATPFLRACASRTAGRSTLLAFVRQQFHYSRHFTRYLSALLCALPDEEDRHALTANLFEEMGLGSPGAKPHALLYREMMIAMGVPPDDRAPGSAPNAATLALVSTMLRLCMDEDAVVGLGALCLGAEALVPTIYPLVVDAFRAIGEPEENLAFFLLHIEADDAHARTMQVLIDRALRADPSSIARLEGAAREAIEARARFFEALA